MRETQVPIEFAEYADREPFHQLNAAGSQLVSHLEIVTVPVVINDHQYRAINPPLLTYPAFRGRRMQFRLNAAAVLWIDDSDANLKLVTCSADLIGFYSLTGWSHASEATIVAGHDGEEPGCPTMCC